MSKFGGKIRQIPPLDCLGRRTRRHRQGEILLDPPGEAIRLYLVRAHQDRVRILSCSVLGHISPVLPENPNLLNS
jgi:hypothetical protein